MFSGCVGHLAADSGDRAGWTVWATQAMWAPRAGALQAVPARIPLSPAFPGTLSTLEPGSSDLMSRPVLRTTFSPEGISSLSLEAVRTASLAGAVLPPGQRMGTSGGPL